MKKIDRVKWAVESQRLLAHQQRHSVIPAQLAREAAERLGVHERSVYRKLRVPPRRRSRFELEERHQLYVVQAGSIRAAVELARAAGDRVSESTFRARWRELPSGVRHGLRRGERAMRAHQGYVWFEAKEPNDVIQADSMYPEVMTRERREWLDLPPERRADVPEPVLRIFAGIDDKTRFIRMSDVGLTPVNADVVRSCMADAVRGEVVEGTFVGGIVREWRWDNALEHLATKVADAAERLGAEKVAPVMPYAGWMKGKIERHWRTQKDEFWSRQPGWYGDDESPFVTPLAVDQLKTCAQLAAEYAVWEAAYNRTRVHSATKMTPLDAWRASVKLVVAPPDEAFALAYQCSAKAVVVRKFGVEFSGRTYAAPALGDIVGMKVHVASSRRYTDVVYVMRDGEYYGTAKDVALLTDDEQNAIYSHREAGTRHVIRIRQAAIDTRAVAGDPADPSLDPRRGDPVRSAEDEYLAYLEGTSRQDRAS